MWYIITQKLKIKISKKILKQCFAVIFSEWEKQILLYCVTVVVIILFPKNKIMCLVHRPNLRKNLEHDLNILKLCKLFSKYFKTYTEAIFSSSKFNIKFYTYNNTMSYGSKENVNIRKKNIFSFNKYLYVYLYNGVYPSRNLWSL